MRLAVLDLHRRGGHHFSFLRTVLKEAHLRGWKTVVVLSNEAVNHASFQLIQDAFDSNCNLEVIENLRSAELIAKGSWLKRQFYRYGEMQRAYTLACRGGCIPEAVFIPDCDGWYAAGALLGRVTSASPLVSVAFNIRYHREEMGISTKISWLEALIQKQLYEICLRRRAVNIALVSDETFIEYQRRHNGSLLKSVGFLPEIADLPPLMSMRKARALLRIPNHKHVVLCYGSLSRRKGLPELFKALADKRCPTAVSALVAGEADSEMREFMKGEMAQTLRHQERLFSIDSFLDEKQTGMAFGASDSAWLGYRNFENTSGFLWQAARAGLPVIGCRDGLISYWTKGRELGPTVDPDNVREVVIALKVIASDFERKLQWSRNGIREAKEHTLENFGRTICDALSRV
jgi:glycosyltransferase involved in cell wall biosynthesis